MITYKSSGVNVDAGNALVKKIKKIAPGIGGFSGAFPLFKKKYKKPLLVSSADGVGTKLKLAFLLNIHDTVGIDLVAMNVNDLLCCGAEPLFFLDYFACGKLQVRQAEQVIKGIAQGCKQAGCVLLGGETAEMPGFYKKGEYDLAGFAVGAVESKNYIDGRKISPGDMIIGLPSSGLHSNGFSMVRKILSGSLLKKYGKLLLQPTRIYAKYILPLVKTYPSGIKGMVHITGGGFYDNIPRILPKACRAVIDKKAWFTPEIFSILKHKGNVSEHEMYRTFNMGIGMILIVSMFAWKHIRHISKDAVHIGYIEKGFPKVVLR